MTNSGPAVSGVTKHMEKKMKANGTWKQKISGLNIEIKIENQEATYLVEGGYMGGGTCEDAGDLLGIIANAVDHATAGTGKKIIRMDAAS